MGKLDPKERAALQWMEKAIAKQLLLQDLRPSKGSTANSRANDPSALAVLDTHCLLRRTAVGLALAEGWPVALVHRKNKLVEAFEVSSDKDAAAWLQTYAKAEVLPLKPRKAIAK